MHAFYLIATPLSTTAILSRFLQSPPVGHFRQQQLGSHIRETSYRHATFICPTAAVLSMRAPRLSQTVTTGPWLAEITSKQEGYWTHPATLQVVARTSLLKRTAVTGDRAWGKETIRRRGPTELVRTAFQTLDKTE
jgi:hypothetical protein